MCTTLLPPAQWAQMEFALAELGDRRRTHRLVNIATRLAQNPGGTLPQALPDWSELKAAYRFSVSRKTVMNRSKALIGGARGINAANRGNIC